MVIIGRLFALEIRIRRIDNMITFARDRAIRPIDDVTSIIIKQFFATFSRTCRCHYHLEPGVGVIALILPCLNLLQGIFLHLQILRRHITLLLLCWRTE
jgi:hypothetical protein